MLHQPRIYHQGRGGITALIAVLLLGACSISGPLRVDRTAQSYDFMIEDSRWEKQPAQDGADLLFANKENGATLSVSSICDRYEEAPLASLASSALSPLGFFKEKEKRSFQIDGREAYNLYVEGKMDGVPVEVDFVVLRKNDCLFDFSLQATPRLNKKDRETFLKAIQNFHYRSSASKKGNE